MAVFLVKWPGRGTLPLSALAEQGQALFAFLVSLQLLGGCPRTHEVPECTQALPVLRPSLQRSHHTCGPLPAPGRPF